MKRFAFVLVTFLVVCTAVFAGSAFDWHFAADVVPGVTPLDFQAAASPEASAIWSILAGQGTWGVLIFAIMGVVWKFARPYLEAWLAERRLAKLFHAVETGVMSVKEAYSDAVKAAHADGKFTAEEAAAARDKAKAVAIAYMKSQGVDVVKEYGHAFLDSLIEYVLAMLKIESKVAKAVIAPLPDLAP